VSLDLHSFTKKSSFSPVGSTEMSPALGLNTLFLNSVLVLTSILMSFKAAAALSMVGGGKYWPATSGEPVHGVVAFSSSNSSSSSLLSDSFSAGINIAALGGMGFPYEPGGFVGNSQE
jgi:hypothetical protein